VLGLVQFMLVLDVTVLSFGIAAALLAVGAFLVLMLLEQVTAQPRNPLAELDPDRH
jgi:hypothetical protein